MVIMVDLASMVHKLQIHLEIPKLNLKGLNEVAYLSNVMAILMYKGYSKLLIGEIPINLKVCGVNRKVDVYGRNKKGEIIAEIERDREKLQGELIALKDALKKYSKEQVEIIGFLLTETQEYNSEFLWSTTVRAYQLDDIPIFRIDVKRGLACI
jgi:hypothetical protein